MTRRARDPLLVGACGDKRHARAGNLTLYGHRRTVAIASRPGEFHPESLTDPDVILSHHPARAIARRLPPRAWRGRRRRGE